MAQRFFRFPKTGGSNKLTKWLSVLMKVIGGVFVFYLVLVWVILPLVLVVAVPSQGSKFLKTPVKLRSVFFHPFLWQLHINGFAILDQQQQPMVGFDKLSVDVSFTNFFKKIYRVESVELEGLSVHTVLLPDGKINLLALVPPAPTESTAPAKPQAAPEEKSGAVPAEVEPATGTETIPSKSMPLV
ncbi:MAG TPA: hypothetical protein VLJ10_05395, partial [Candidatus Bathyarchaeia archaeon]|nr:hypothetical protein [Candidatus Bathyarchaeia archaeon]